MSTLKKFHHTKVANEALATFARTTLTHLDAHIEDLYIERQRKAIYATLEEYNHAFTRELGNSFTKTLKKLDDKRDGLLIAILATLEATVAQRVLSEKRADDAETILALYHKMDSNVKQIGYSKESAQINAFISAVVALSKETLQSSGIKALFEALCETEASFDEIYSSKSSSDEQPESIRRMSSIRKDTTSRLDALFSYINMNSIDLPEQYGSTVVSLNSLIGETMSKAM